MKIPDELSQNARSVYATVMIHHEHNLPRYTIKMICNATGLERRAVEMATEEIRDAGIPLCSSTRAPMGLYIATTPEEYAPYYRQLWSRIGKMMRRAAAGRDTLIRLAATGAEGEQLALRLEMEAKNEQRIK